MVEPRAPRWRGHRVNGQERGSVRWRGDRPDGAQHFDQDTGIHPEVSAGLLQGHKEGNGMVWAQEIHPAQPVNATPPSGYIHVPGSTAWVGTAAPLFTSRVTLGRILQLTISHLQFADNDSTYSAGLK